MSDSIVIIPTYNEKENVENIIRAVFGLEKVFHILIIDDGSPDGTADIVKRLQTEFPEQLFMIERKGKLGLGTAYICGFKWSIEHKYDYIFEMDADFSHNPNDLPRLYAACAQLAFKPCVDVVWCFDVCTLRHRNQCKRYDGRFQMLSTRSARNDRFGSYSF